MAELFSMDAEGLIRLRKFYKKGPKAFKKAAAFVLTGFALGVKRNSRDVIDEEFTLRNKKFIHGTLRVTKANPNEPISKMQAVFGAQGRPRFTGLAEQELGKAGPRDRVMTSAARDGNFSATAKGYARLKPNAKYASPTNANLITGKKAGRKNFSLAGLTGAKRIVAFLSLLNESKRDQTFIIRRRFGRFKRGLYRFARGKIKKLQAFDTKEKPKRVKWMTKGRKRYFEQTNISDVWAKGIRNQIKKLR